MWGGHFSRTQRVPLSQKFVTWQQNNEGRVRQQQPQSYQSQRGRGGGGREGTCAVAVVAAVGPVSALAVGAGFTPSFHSCISTKTSHNNLLHQSKTHRHSYICAYVHTHTYTDTHTQSSTHTHIHHIPHTRRPLQKHTHPHTHSHLKVVSPPPHFVSCFGHYIYFFFNPSQLFKIRLCVCTRACCEYVCVSGVCLPAFSKLYILAHARQIHPITLVHTHKKHVLSVCRGGERDSSNSSNNSNSNNSDTDSESNNRGDHEKSIFKSRSVSSSQS